MKKGLVPTHTRYDYVPLNERKDYNWPGGKRLAFCITTNVEVFAFGKGRGHDNAKPSTTPLQGCSPKQSSC